MEGTEERIRELQDRATEIIQFGEQRKKRLGCVCGAGGGTSGTFGTISKGLTSNMCFQNPRRSRERDYRRQKNIWRNNGGKFPTLMKDIGLQIQKT